MAEKRLNKVRGLRPLRIVFLSRFLGTVNRGAETYVLELSKRLNKTCDVSVLSGKNADSWSIIVNGKYDLVIPTNGRLQALKASIGRLFSGHKLLISGQAGIGKDDLWNIIFCLPNIYVALTDYQANWAKQWAWNTKIVKIPNGVDLEKFSPLGGKVNLDLPKPIILSVGALEWYKHHDLAIKAVAGLRNGSLLIIGSGPLEKELSEMGNNLLGAKRFRIMGADYEQMPNFYRSVDLFTLPSWDREAFGIVYVEAMASGLGVVAANDLSRKEITGDAGILVDVNNISEYTNALKEALQKDWQDLPRKQAEKFSWDKITQQYTELINKMFHI
ncbi:MAG: glycosyltransferase [Candidatus Daviesbacteria bacterium]|nr:glycosyltransferase [Candidatus Daviesbacteria bacterium]